jgi:hypothetical protein
MEEYVIYVNQVEELQMVNDTNTLDIIFQRTKRMLVGGGTIALVRKNTNGREDKFDDITTLDDMEAYRKTVYKNLQ